MSEENNKLALRFDPGTIEHLGIKMYSQLPQALAELVANAYDADASEVIINLYDNDKNNKKIVVNDNGIGMSYEDVRDKFLVIGRNRRPEDEKRTTLSGRTITGRKGLGKLALFGIGNEITIETTKANNSKKIKFSMNWNKIIGKEPITQSDNSTEKKQGNAKAGTIKEYNPIEEIIEKQDSSEQGTTIMLTELKRVSNFELKETAIALSKMFNTFGNGFKVVLRHNDNPKNQIELTRELRYEKMAHEFEWNVEEKIIPNIDADGYKYKDKVKGWIVSSPEGKTMKQTLRGITLYVNGRLANIPSFFGVGETPHAFSYLSGWIDADFLDEFYEDLIATDRQTLSWDLPEAEELKKFLQKIVKFVAKAWESGRRENKQKANADKAGVNLEEWYGTLPNEKMKKDIEHIVNKVSDNSKLDTDEYSVVVKKLHEIVPDYPLYHWRELHSSIQDASQKLYKEDKNYYEAFCEAMKRYKNAVKDKSNVQFDCDMDIVSNAFGKETNKPLETTARFKIRPNGRLFSKQTLENIEEGQLALSRGVVQGGRNVVSHEEHQDLKSTGLFTEKDCLDLLSLLSHLFKRLDESEKRAPNSAT